MSAEIKQAHLASLLLLSLLRANADFNLVCAITVCGGCLLYLRTDSEKNKQTRKSFPKV